MTRARRTVVALGLVLAATAPGLAQAATPQLELREVRGSRFPDRSFVLELPTGRPLDPKQVTVTEGGEPVDHLEVTPGNEAGERTFGVVLAIDASSSIRGRPLEAAMAAARVFAARRAPKQQLGVIYFSRSPTVALAPTADASRIAATLATTPPVTHGTRIFDAVHMAVEVLKQARISAGTVIVLSDGADSGSQATLDDVAAEAVRARVQLYTVGLRSASYEPDQLRGLAAAGDGAYALARSSRDLAPIFDALGRRFGSQYLVTYRSPSALQSRVEVRATVADIAGEAKATYMSPARGANASAGRLTADAWGSTEAVLAIALALAALFGGLVFLLLRPKPRNTRALLEPFLLLDGTETDAGLGEERDSPLGSVERRLARRPGWRSFDEQVQLARIGTPAIRIAVAGAVGTLLLGWLLAKAAGPGMAIFALAVPLGIRTFVKVLLRREQKEFGEQLPSNLQVLASAMRAGHSFTGALSVTVDDAAEPSRTEFKRVVADEQIGVPIEEALASVARRMDNSDLEYVGLIANLQRESGGNTAEVLDRVTDTIRARAELRRLVSGLTAQGRLGGGIISLLPIGLFVVLKLVSPDYLEPLLTTGAGKLALAFATLLMMAGILVIRKIVDIKL
jgi:tight adherence protein B